MTDKPTRSRTLTALVEDALSDNRGHRGEPTLMDVALIAAFDAREAVGLKRYGTTVDDQKGRDQQFWIRMAREELCDAAIYLQRAAIAAGGKKADEWDHELQSAARDLGHMIRKLISRGDPGVLNSIASHVPPLDLFPPCEVAKKKETE